MQPDNDPEIYRACEAVFLESLGRDIKSAIQLSGLGSPEQQETLFGQVLSVVAGRASGHGGACRVGDIAVYPSISYLRYDGARRDANEHAGRGGSSLHEHVEAVLATLKSFTPREFVIDGATFSTLEGFYETISRVMIPDAQWGRNLDAFNDILRGGFGTPEEGFVLRWKNSDRSRQSLGYPETVRQLESRLERCHPSNRSEVKDKIALARSGRGSTTFDWLVEIIERHGAGGSESTSNIALILE